MGAVEARMFAQEGAKVVVGDVLDAEGASVAAEIAESGGDALFVHLDVTDEEGWRRAIGAAVTTFGKLDVLVNNAGIWRGGRVEDTTVEDWDTISRCQCQGRLSRDKASHPGNEEGRRWLDHQHLFHCGAGRQFARRNECVYCL